MACCRTTHSYDPIFCISSRIWSAQDPRTPQLDAAVASHGLFHLEYSTGHVSWKRVSSAPVSPAYDSKIIIYSGRSFSIPEAAVKTPLPGTIQPSAQLLTALIRGSSFNTLPRPFSATAYCVCSHI